MGIPEYIRATTTDRKARNAILASIGIISIAFWNMGTVVWPLLTGQPASLLVIIEIILILGQIASAISAFNLIRRGELEVGVLRLTYSFMVTSVVRTILRESIGLHFGIITAVAVSSTMFLALSPRRARRNALIGFGVGGAIILFDVFASALYSRQPTAPAIMLANTYLALFVFANHLVVLFLESRNLSFASKIASYFSTFTVIVVFVLGYFAVQVLQSRIAGADLELLRQGTVVTGVIVAFLGALAGVLIAHTLTEPLSRLAQVTSQLEAGNLEARAVIHGEDEIGELAAAFNSMAGSLQGLFGQLETRVQERTADLERRALQIQTAAEVGRASTTLSDLDSLLTRTTYLISERFGFYHAGVFLLDHAGEYAVLRAANSDGGLQMLERGHRLKIGETGIVGFVTHSGQARIALDVGADAVFFNNPDLPNTRSEMALPLIIGGRILGALDVQSTQPQAFKEQDVATLHIVADQLAIAIENARLFSETQQALESARFAYGDISREAWKQLIKNQPRISYVSTGAGSARPSTSAPSADVIRAVQTGDVILSDEGNTIGIPIKVRGQAIGALRLRKQDTSHPWTNEESALAIALAEQLSGALESARLYKESQQRAARESLVSDISARITALPRVDTILRETVQELGQAIGNAAITFQLLETPDERQQVQAPDNGSGKDRE